VEDWSSPSTPGLSSFQAEQVGQAFWPWKALFFI